MQDLISFTFDEHPIRVVLVDGQPWWVAADLCAILGLGNTPEAVRRLDDDQKGVRKIDTLGGAQSLNIVSESGMWTLVLRSNKPEAARLRRLLTDEVLPALRRHGTYSLASAAPLLEADGPVQAHWDPGQLHASVDCVREARRLFGPQSARLIWRRLGLPSPTFGPGAAGDPMMVDLQEYCRTVGECTIEDAAAALGLGELDHTTRMRLGALLRELGWHPRRKRRQGQLAYVYTPADAFVPEAE